MPVLEKPKSETLPSKKTVPPQFWAFIFLPLSFLFLETVAHLFFFGFRIGSDTLLRSASALGAGFLFSLIALCFKDKGRQIFTAVVLGGFGLFFSVHFVYQQGIHAFLSWQILGLAGDVVEFWRETLVSILLSSHKIILSFTPFILYLIFGKRLNPFNKKSAVKVSAVCAAALTVITAILLIIFPRDFSAIYFVKNDLSRAFKTFGVVPASAMDLVQTVFGAPEEELIAPPPVPVPEENREEYNVLDIDFSSLISSETDEEIREMHEYFETAPATKKNEYSGMFKGKNLIFLSLEAFSYKALDPEYTPTLYKMANEGFRFTNFYAPLWGGSTATGEYANLTGNFYTLANCIETSADTNQYFALGNLFARGGYNTYGFHNHTYTYYGRDRSHPNFGFPNFKAIGNGLTLLTDTWPRSDYEMAKVTAGDYIGNAPFLAYYMTVSGHANFTWSANQMAERHRYDINPELTYSENVKAYLATQIEVELMLRELLAQLEAAGQLENTVFAMTCDHLPYALTDLELSELYSLPEEEIRNNYELYRNAFILWSPTMEEPVTVDKPCASYDILPTLANLFGVSYDSRLLAGKDILSEQENPVLINTLGSGGSWNWITENGTFDAMAGEFTKSDTCTLDGAALEEYIAVTQRRVDAMRKYTLKILERDYYSYVFK